jgi:hypothetical protein
MRTAATWLSVRYAANTTPVADQIRPIAPITNATGEVGSAAAASSTVSCSAGGTIAVITLCRSSGSVASRRETIATPSSSSGNRLRKP